ncbi:MAG: hypothetical protein V3R52_06795 [Candidatus Neomarinimicrobiota bacterium]
MKKVKNKKLYLSILLISHGIIFTVIMKGVIFNSVGIALFVLGGIYFILGMRDKKLSD